MKPADSNDPRICLMTGGQDPHYASGLALALAARGVELDIIGSDALDLPQFRGSPHIHFLNLRGDQSGRGSGLGKTWRWALFYMRLLRYAIGSRARLFHILWNNRFEHFDRTLLLVFYRLLRRKIAFTAHNINIRRRDGGDSWFNRWTLRIQYRLAHRIFVHTHSMKSELVSDFGVSPERICVIPYGINNATPETGVTVNQARARLDLPANTRILLCFGAIAPYKGLDLLIDALVLLEARGTRCLTVIAGKPKGGCETYLEQLRAAAGARLAPGAMRFDIGFVPDDRTELYFKAADAMLLPYRNIFQSGALFLGFGYGLPAIATDVGDFREDVIDGQTGFLAASATPRDFAAAIERYLASELCSGLAAHRGTIRELVHARHSWDSVAALTLDTYHSALGCVIPAPAVQ